MYTQNNFNEGFLDNLNNLNDYKNYKRQKQIKKRTKDSKKVTSFKKMRKTLKKKPQLSKHIYVKSHKKSYKPIKNEQKIVLEEFIRRFKVKEDRLYYKNKEVVLFVPK